jgi:hypothetical protein
MEDLPEFWGSNSSKYLFLFDNLLKNVLLKDLLTGKASMLTK